MTHETYRIYSRVLKFGQKIGLRRFIETTVFAITIFAITSVYFVVLTRTAASTGLSAFTAAGTYIFFPIGLFAEIALILSYIENRYQIDIFGDNINKFFGFFSFISITVIILYSSIPGLYLNGQLNAYNISIIVLFFLLALIETGYFLYSSPRLVRSETFGLEYQFSNMEKRLKDKRLIDLPIEKAINKGLTALKRRVTEEGLWGDLSPVYETACVLDLFHTLGYNKDTEWIISTTEGKKTFALGQAIDNLETIINTAEHLNSSMFCMLLVCLIQQYSITESRK
ncbi:MAG: hypothetical protein ACXABJ_05825 [Candidatus Heimdallarchaeaceae archaeon]|jgi:hypothetical protein